MPRAREFLWRHEPTVNAAIDLLMGPTDAPGELTIDQLEVAWQLERDRLLSEYRGPPGTRPWACWWFDLGEQQPHDWAAEPLGWQNSGSCATTSWRRFASGASRPG